MVVLIDFPALMNEYWLHAMLLFIFYFIVCGILVLKYALKTRNNAEKQDHPEYFKNEVLIALLLFFNAAIYPFLFNNIVPEPNLTRQIYFFVGLEALINLIVWIILIPLWKFENFIFWKYIVKKPHRTYESWKEKIRKNWNDSGLRDFIRKLIHFAYIFLVLFFWYQFEDNPLGGGWTSASSAVYYQANVLYGFTIVMVLFDILRLTHWKVFGAFARIWAESCIKPSELDTFNSASPMLLTILPFIYFGHDIFYCVILIASVSDAMASIIGKNFGKKKVRNNKTRAGFIAGAVSTYIIVILIDVLSPFPGISTLEVHVMAAITAIGFCLVDMFVEDLTDNFANPLVCGLILVLTNFIFTL
ncbi:MAG: hypothetical protein GF364_10430 [Candidatus Lokiarchaeota archaeon]|nr:hypothetical protein [Candidatus Lokiarchaeota archaeon]